MSANTIVVGIGKGDEDRTAAITRAVRGLARDPADEVILVHVYADEDRDRLEEMLDVPPSGSAGLDAAVRHNVAVRSAAEELDAVGISPTYAGAFGDPSDSLVALARERSADYLVVGGRKRSPTGKVVFGSTAQSVMFDAPCPVVFVKRGDSVDNS